MDEKQVTDSYLYLLSLTKELPPELANISLEVLDDPRFHEAPGGKEHHHNYKHGLLIHTKEVTSKARSMATDAEQPLITCAAIVHDYHKIFEYAFDSGGKIYNLPYRKLIGHVVGSWGFFQKMADLVGLDEETKLIIGHCLLSHHGRLEWRSPVEPQTKLAHMLHIADMMSMQGLAGE